MKLNDRGSGYLNEEQAQKALLTSWDPDMKVDDELAAMENMACYETVLNDIRRSYLDGLTNPAEGEAETDSGLTADEREEWDGYLHGLLKRVSPDNSVDEAEQGITELCRLAGFNAETMNLEELAEKLSQMRRIRELEELIVEEKLKTASYQGSPYREEFKEYTHKVFDTEDEKREAFRSAGFYQIIEGMKAEMEQEAKESGPAQQGSVLWNEKMTEILGAKVANGNTFLTLSQVGSLVNFEKELKPMMDRIGKDCGNVRSITLEEKRITYFALEDHKERELFSFYKDGGIYVLRLKSHLSDTKGSKARSSWYDYQILSAILLKVSPAGMKLAEAVYSSWEDDNQYGVKSGEWVLVGDAWMTYEGESGAGIYRITNQ